MIPGWGRTNPHGVLELQWRAVMGNMTQQFPSLTQFFCLLSLTFVIFPHFSALHRFLCTMKELDQLFSNCAAWSLLRAWLGPVHRVKGEGLQLKISTEPRAPRLNNLRILRLDGVSCLFWCYSSGVICHTSQSPLPTPNITNNVHLLFPPASAECACVPGTVLSPGCSTENKTDLVLTPMNLTD